MIDFDRLRRLDEKLRDDGGVGYQERIAWLERGSGDATDLDNLEVDIREEARFYASEGEYVFASELFAAADELLHTYADFVKGVPYR